MLHVAKAKHGNGPGIAEGLGSEHAAETEKELQELAAAVLRSCGLWS